MELHVRLGNGWEKNISFTSDVLSFGSHPQCDILLSEADVQPLHFKLIRHGKNLHCIPYANNMTVQRGDESITLTPNAETAIRNGDRIRIDSARIQIEIKEGAKKRFPFFYPLMGAIALFLIFGAVGVLSRPRIENFKTAEDPDGRRSLVWETGGIFLEARIDDGKTVRTVSPRGTLPLPDSAQGSFSLSAENRLSRLFNYSEQQTLIVPTKLPSPTLQPTNRPTSVPISLKLESEETAPNVVYLRWEIRGDQETKAQLQIGPETIAINKEQFNGERTIRLNANTDVELKASNGTFEKSERIRLSYRPRKAQILKFIVWLETESGAAKEKIAELLPDPRAEDAYRVQSYRNVSLKKGERLLIEWDVRDADTLTIAPLSNRLLPFSGAIAYVPSATVNFTMTAFSGGQRLDVSIPIRLERDSFTTGPNGSNQALRTATPVKTKIDFFKANPVTLTQPGETTIVWSVSGPYEQIRLSDGERELGADLAASGIRKIPVQNDLTLMLQADSPSGTISAFETIRVKNDTAVLRPTTIAINDIFPKKSTYTVGDRVQISVAFVGQPTNQSAPTGSVLIGDGVSSCVVSLPRESCELLLRTDGDRTFSIRYSGDRNYSPSETAVNLIVKPFVRQAVNLKLTTFRNQTVFAPGDKIRLIAEFEPGNIGGTLFFNDGVRSCLVTLPRNSCELTALDPGSSRVSVAYSGDEKHAPAEDAITVISSLIEATVTPTPIPLELKITQLYPEKETYAIGDSIDVYVSLKNNAGKEGAYKNRVRISDGISVCYLNLNTTNHCSLRLVQARRGQIQAEYPGDELFGSAKSAPIDITVLPEALPTATPNASRRPTALTITKIYPERQSFTVGDTIEVYVALTNEDGTEEEYGGRIRISDGVAVCTLNPNLTNHCSLKLVHPQIGKLTAAYSGDETFSPAQTEIPITVKPSTKLPSQTLIAGVEPRKDAYELNEQITIKVAVSEKTPDGGKNPSGAVLIQAGQAACEIDLALTDTCILKLTDPNTVQITAEYAGDDSFAPSAAPPFPLRIRLMSMTLRLLAEKFSDGNCLEAQPDLSAPIPMTTVLESGSEIRLFTLDERFNLGRGFYLDAEVELYGGLFEDSGGTFTVSACAISEPESCVESGPVSVGAPSPPDSRITSRIYLPPPLLAGRHNLTVEFRAANPSFGTYREQAALDQIYPGQLILIPSGGRIDWNAQRVTAENIDAGPERDQTLDFEVYQIRDQASACALPLASVFPAPTFSTIEIRVEASVPGAAESDAIWKQSFRDQGIPDEFIEKLQPNRTNWYGDRCQFYQASNQWRLSCRRIGLTEPSRLFFSGDVADPNYQTSELSKFPIDISIGKHVVAILPAHGWIRPAAGKIYWLNARGDDFNYWAAEDCYDLNATGFQTSVSRIPEDQVLTVDTKLLSRALSNQLRLQNAEGPLTITPASGAQWTVLPTYHGVCGSCTPRTMMDFAWIANEGCAEDSNSITITEKNGKLFDGQTCENNERKQVLIRSSFCQIKINDGGGITFSLPENESQLAATLQLTSGRGRGLDPYTEQPITEQPIRAEIGLFDDERLPLRTLSVGETARFQIRLSRPLADGEKIEILVPAFLDAANLYPDASSCTNWSISETNRWSLDPTQFAGADVDSVRPQAECTLTFRTAIENLAAPVFQIQYPDGSISDWTGFPTAIRKRETIVVPSLKLTLSSDSDDGGQEQISGTQIERLYANDTDSALDPLARYRFEVRLTNTAELPADVSPEDMLLIKAPLFSKLRDLGTLDSCWESAEGDAFRLRVGASCGFRIPPHGISQSDLGAIEISVDSPRYEGTRTILIGENALERETVAIRAFPPQQRRIGKDSEIRFIIDPERSEYASAWIARNGANLLSIEASENLTENCSGGLNFDTIGNAGCIVGGGISSGEAETLIVRIGSVALPDQLDIRLVNGNDGSPLIEIVLPSARPIELNGAISLTGIPDQVIIENDVLVEFQLAFDPNETDTVVDPDEIVRIEAPIFHAADVYGTCGDLAALPWIEEEKGVWIKRCDFRWSTARSLTDPERTIVMTSIDERYAFPIDRSPSLTLPAEVSRRPLRLTTVSPMPEVRIGSELIRWTIQIDGGGLPIDPDLFSVRANEMNDLDCQFSDDLTIAECALIEEIPGDSIRLQAAYSGDRIFSEAALHAEPIRMVRFALNVAPLAPLDDPEPASLSLPMPDHSKHPGVYLYRDDLDRVKLRFFSLNSDAPAERESCLTPPTGFALEADLELTNETKRMSFNCQSPETFDAPLICELSAFGNPDFDPDSLRRIHGLTLTFAGDDCFDPLQTEVDFEPTTIVDFVPIETTANGEAIQIEVPEFAWESLTVYCDQDGVPLICEVGGYERDCWGIPAPLPIEGGFIEIAATNAYAPTCQWVGTNQEGQITHGGTAY